MSKLTKLNLIVRRNKLMNKPVAAVLVYLFASLSLFADDMVYVSGGNMGVGNPSPAAKLDVAGNAIIAGGELSLGGTIFRSTGFGTMTKNYTDFDGSGDYTSSSNSDLQMSGSMTVAFEVKFTDEDTLMNYISVGSYVAPPSSVALIDGFRIFRYGGDTHGFAVQIMKDSGSVTTIKKLPTPGFFGNTGLYNEVVFVYDDSANTVKYYVNGTEIDTVTGIEIKDPTDDFVIGGWIAQSADNLLDGTMRNVTVYEGAATNPTSWTPNDPNSLTGTGLTLKMFSPNGSGTDNAQGISFSVSGDPVIIGNEPVFTFDEQQGYVGIGTGEPSFELQVIGDVSAAAFLVSSDERLKRDIEPLTGSLNKLNLFGGKSYEKKITDAIANSTDAGTVAWESEIGFIAQEIEEAFPECVKEDKNGVKFVNYTALIPVLCEALKEVDAKHQVQLKAMRDDFEARIRALEARQ